MQVPVWRLLSCWQKSYGRKSEVAFRQFCLPLAKSIFHKQCCKCWIGSTQLAHTKCYLYFQAPILANYLMHIFVYLFVFLGKKLQGGTSHRLFSGSSCKGSQSKVFRQKFLKLFAVSSPACTTGLLGQLWLISSSAIFAPHIHICNCILSLPCSPFLNILIVFNLSFPHCCLLTSSEKKLKKKTVKSTVRRHRS